MLWAATVCYLAVAVIEKFVVFTSPDKFGSVDARLVDLILLSVNLILFAGLMHLFISAIDIADYKSKQLSRSNAELSAVWQTAPVGLCIANADLTDIRLNPHGAMLLGVIGDENITPDLKASRIKFARDNTPVNFERLPFIQASVENMFVSALEWDIIGPTGKHLTVLLAAAPVREIGSPNPRDHIRERVSSGAVAAFVDISHAKQLQHELDLRRREAEEASVRKTRFLSAVSHDIRNPTNAISLLAELLGHASSTPSMAGEIPKFAAELRASSRRLVDLVTDVLDFTKIDVGTEALAESEVSLRDLIEEECGQAGRLGAAKKIDVQCPILSQDIILWTDRVKLGRVIGNLLSNAVKFTERGSVNVLAEHAPSGDLLISVHDTGPGIPADAVGKIFDEFYQVKMTSQSRQEGQATTTGAGLGLAICKKLTAAMGMRLEVISELGKGSTFTLVVPRQMILTSGENRTNA